MYFTIILYIIYLVGGGGVIFITSFLERRWLLKYNTFLAACVLESGLHMSNDLIYYLSTCKQVGSVAWFISRQWKKKIITRHIVYFQYFYLNKVRNHVMNGILFFKRIERVYCILQIIQNIVKKKKKRFLLNLKNVIMFLLTH